MIYTTYTASRVGSVFAIFRSRTTSHNGRYRITADDLYDLYDLYDHYDLHDLYVLYDLYNLYYLYDLYDLSCPRCAMIFPFRPKSRSWRHPSTTTQGRNRGMLLRVVIVGSKMSGDGQSRKNVPRSVKGVKSIAPHWKIVIWRQSTQVIGKLPSVKVSKGRLLTYLVIDSSANYLNYPELNPSVLFPCRQCGAKRLKDLAWQTVGKVSSWYDSPHKLFDTSDIFVTRLNFSVGTWLTSLPVAKRTTKYTL